MADMGCCDANGGFREAVCIDAGRIYDSCSDKDCLTDLQLYFTQEGQQIIDEAISVKAKSAEVLNVYLDVEAVPFNRGFYSVDITFFFLVDLVASTQPLSEGTSLRAVATFSKKVILFGSEGAVRVFTSTEPREGLTANRHTNSPTASVQVVDPLVLAFRLTDYRRPDSIPTFPESVLTALGGPVFTGEAARMVLTTLGLFTIVQLERRVQMMVPVYDFCIPDKESVCTTGDPCEMFEKIKFPTGDFFPPRLSDDESCD